MTQKKTRITFVHDKVLRFMPFSLLCIFFTIELSESCAVCEQMWNFPRNNKKRHIDVTWIDCFSMCAAVLSLVSRVWWIRTIFCSSSSLVDCIAIDFSLSREYMLLLRYVRRAHNPRLSRAFMPSIASNMSLSINNDLINLLIESSIEASKTQ